MIQIDTNLFEDAIRKRLGWKSSSAVISWVKKGDVEGGVSAWTVATIYYFRRRLGACRREILEWRLQPESGYETFWSGGFSQNLAISPAKASTPGLKDASPGLLRQAARHG